MPSIAKVIEVMAQSETSWEDAVQSALIEASKTIRHIQSIYVSEFQAVVEDDQITNYRINAKITFVVEG